MKKILLVSALILVSAFAKAQTLIPKAGLTLSTVAIEESDDIKSKLGFTLGLGFQLNVNEMFSIQPELNFGQKGFKIEDSYTEDFDGVDINYSGEYRVTLNYLEIPVMAKVTFGTGTKFYLNAGPSLGFGLSGKYKEEFTASYQGDSETEKYDGKIKFGNEPDNYEGEDEYFDNRIDFGLQLGGGIVIAEKIMLDIRYGLGLSNLYDDDFKSQNRVLQFTVGIPLNLK